MTYKGTVKDGVIVLEGGTVLPDGEVVEVHAAERSAQCGSTLYDRLKDVVGAAKGLPSDAARNSEHYLYGAPKR